MPERESEISALLGIHLRQILRGHVKEAAPGAIGAFRGARNVPAWWQQAEHANRIDVVTFCSSPEASTPLRRMTWT